MLLLFTPPTSSPRVQISQVDLDRLLPFQSKRRRDMREAVEEEDKKDAKATTKVEVDVEASAGVGQERSECWAVAKAGAGAVIGLVGLFFV